MFAGYMKLGDVELANNSRVQTYAPSVVGCNKCDDLAEALNETYVNPGVDRAGWTIGNNQGVDFAGLIVTALTGLHDGTREMTVTERILAGGVPGASRNASRVIGVTALGIAYTESGMNAGIDWLTSVLTGPCITPSCVGTSLHLFSECPSICDHRPDTNADPVTLELSSLSADWSLDAGAVARSAGSRTYTNFAPSPSSETSTDWVADPGSITITQPGWPYQSNRRSIAEWALGGGVVARTNLVARPYFVKSGATTPWTLTGTAHVSASVDDLVVGQNGYLGGTSGSMTSDEFAVTPNLPYTFSFDITRAGGGASAPQLLGRIRWYTSGLVFISDTIGTAYNQTGGAAGVPGGGSSMVGRKSLTGYAPLNAAFATAYIATGTPAGGLTSSSYVCVNKMMVEQSATRGVYFDGNTPDGLNEYAWVGTVDESASTETSPVTEHATVSTPVAVAQGDELQVRLSVRAASDSQLLLITASYANVSGTLTSPVAAVVEDQTNSWTEVSLELPAAPFGATHVLTTVQMLTLDGPTAGEKHWLDSLMVTGADYRGPYFDGSSPNLVGNPDFEVDAVGWTGTSGTRSNTVAHAGTWSYRVAREAASGTGTIQASYFDASPAFLVEAGTAYVSGAWVRADTTGRNTTATIYWYDSAGVFISNNTVTGSVSDVSSAWRWTSITATAPANAHSAQVAFAVTSVPEGEFHYVDSVRVCTLEEYEYGQTAWAGTLDDSTSTMVPYEVSSDFADDEGIAYYEQWLPPVCGPVTIRFTVTADEPTYVTLGAEGSLGTTVTGSSQLHSGGTEEFTLVVDPTPDFPGSWRPLMIISATAVVGFGEGGFGEGGFGGG